MSGVIKVLIVDDSAVMRSLLSEVLSQAIDIKVVGMAPDPIAAREMIKTLAPDVLTLDVEMPRMDGLDFLGRLMRLRPMPVVMVSSSTERGSENTLEALALGAIDYVTKPRADSPAQLRQYAEEVREKVRAAYSASLKPTTRSVVTPTAAAETGTPLSSRVLEKKLIAIGASTGGTEALRAVLCNLPRDVPGVVMVQHMPDTFTGSFARRLDTLSQLTVVEAQGGERILPGHAYLAPGHSHLLVKRTINGWVTELAATAPVNRHRPSVDVLFDSVAEQVGANAVGVILTGMGKDGARGMLSMKQAGAWNIGQDKDSCVVYGMPREAAEIGALTEVAPLNDIGSRIMGRLRQLDRGTA
ncbi:MAG TPA: chemotaxis response regulator protein-glutamate methylesterase [Rhodocyclaceae bacterium]|nr:chemotaxis response regulator protein-glutamate methylesterase [Rhodocyclaceae bacterium]